MHTSSPWRFALLTCGLLTGFFLFTAIADDPEYELTQPVTLTVDDKPVNLPVGQTVSVMGGTPTGKTAMIRVRLPDGSLTIDEIPTASLRQKPAAATPTPAPEVIPPMPAPAPAPAAAPDSEPAAAPAPAPAAATTSSPADSGVADQFKFKSGGEAGGGTELHKDWKLVWEDDFSKDSQIDRSKWNFEIDGKGGGNGEMEYYTDSPKNAHIENGELLITAIKDDAGHKFTSARMTTKGKFTTLYGRIEACIKAPKSQAGNWPAFWMMPQDSKYGGWPRSGEIDIMELINKSDVLYGTDHFGGEHGDTHEGAKTTAADGDWSKEYHVYAVEWEPKVMRWYVDGKYYGQINQWHSASAPFPAPFDQKFFIILNYAVGGAWPHAPDAKSTYPQSMHVKYVRVYKPQ